MRPPEWRADDRHPVARDQDDRPETIDRLYELEAPRLTRLFARRVGAQDALDLLHEAFIRFATIPTAARDQIANKGAFLTRVATNLLADRAKVRRRRAVDLHVEYEDERQAAPDLQLQLEGRDALARLQRAVDLLPQRRRRIFLLHEVEGLTYEQIAADVGMSVKGVKKQMVKALLQLRGAMGPR